TRSPRHDRRCRAGRSPPPARCRHCRVRSRGDRAADCPRSSRQAHARVRPIRGEGCSWPARMAGGVAWHDPAAKDSGPMTEAPRINIVEFTVSELSAALRRTVEDAYGFVRVRGEISGYRGPHTSGHAYFALKDEGARIEAVIWRTTFGRMLIKPED